MRLACGEAISDGVVAWRMLALDSVVARVVARVESCHTTFTCTRGHSPLVRHFGVRRDASLTHRPDMHTCHERVHAHPRTCVPHNARSHAARRTPLV